MLLILAGSPPFTSPLRASRVWLIKDMVTHFIPKSLFKEDFWHFDKLTPLPEKDKQCFCIHSEKRPLGQRCISALEPSPTWGLSSAQHWLPPQPEAALWFHRTQDTPETQDAVFYSTAHQFPRSGMGPKSLHF